MCRYDPWVVDVFTKKLDDLRSEVNQAIAFSWKSFAFEKREFLDSQALRVKESLLSEWTPIDKPV